MDVWRMILKFINFLINYFTVKKAPDVLPSDMEPPKDLDANVPIDGPKPKRETLSERIAEAAIGMLGRDASPKNLAPQELSCAESVSNVIGTVLLDFPEVVGTPELYDILRKDVRFKRVTDPQKGCIVISPSVVRNGVRVYGHTGIYINDYEIASNSSATGKWTQSHTRQEWIDYYYGHQKLTGYLFQPTDLVL